MAKTTTARRMEKVAEQPAAWSHGTFHWNELMTRDVDRAKTSTGTPSAGASSPCRCLTARTYWCAMLEGEPVAGVFALSSPEYDGMPECWMSYLAVDDVDKRVAKAIKAGAKLMKPIFDVAGVGRIAVLMEPGGAGVGWMTPVNK